MMETRARRGHRGNSYRERAAVAGEISRPRVAPGSCAHHWEVETAAHEGIADAVCRLCGDRREHVAQWERLPGCYRVGVPASSAAEPYIDAWLAEAGLYDGRRQR